MPSSYHADRIIVVNGPEDGTEFPVVRAPLAIGRDPACVIHLRLDRNVKDTHALLSVVADGYRVRRGGAAPVYVDGKRVGAYRSSIVRHGGQIRVGNTLMCLECAPDGLASRSRGIVTETDMGWAVQGAVKWSTNRVYGVARALWHSMGRLVGRIVRSPFALLAILFLMMVFWPWFRYKVFYFVGEVYVRIVSLFTRGSGR